LVANHPFGLVEGAILSALLRRVRPDVKFLANLLLAGIPGLEDCLIPVDPFGGAAKANWRGMRQSIEWLAQGGTLLHVGVHGIQERDHTEMQRRGADFPSFLAYLRERRLLFSVNHMFSPG
jgi:hypothetical protein